MSAITRLCRRRAFHTCGPRWHDRPSQTELPTGEETARLAEKKLAYQNEHGHKNPGQRSGRGKWNQWLFREEKKKPKHPNKPDVVRKLAVKDNIATRGQPTTCASQMLQQYTSPFEATIVTQLRDRGFVGVGKTNMDEFGMGSHNVNSHFGAVYWHSDGHDRPLVEGDTRVAGHKSVGGSSGGSAVAVRIGQTTLALGTDTGGSVRLPAAYNGVVGYKPSYGMLSRFGVVPYANSLDTVGLMAKKVETIRRCIIRDRLFLEHDPRDPTSLPQKTRERLSSTKGYYCYEKDEKERLPYIEELPEDFLSNLTFGVPQEYNIKEMDLNVRIAWNSTIRLLRKYGAKVVFVSLPSTRHALSAYYVIAPAEASSNLAKYDGVRYGNRNDSHHAATADDRAGTRYASTRNMFGDEVQRRILLGSYTLSSEAMDNHFIQAQKVRRLVARDFDRVFKLSNPLREPEQFDLTDLPENTKLQDKTGPPQVDFLMCPTAPTRPPAVADVQSDQSPISSYLNDIFTVPASLAGLPAITIPVFWDHSRLRQKSSDIGIQLIGQYWDDGRLLSAAESLEKKALQQYKAAPDAQTTLGEGDSLGLE